MTDGTPGVISHKDNESVALVGGLIQETEYGYHFLIDGAKIPNVFEKNGGFVFTPEYSLPTKKGIYVEYVPGFSLERLSVYYLRQDGWVNPLHGTAVPSSSIEAAFKARQAVLKRLDIVEPVE